MHRFQHVAPGRRCIFEGPVALTAALTKPTKHYKNWDFPPSDAAHPIFERMTGNILERIGPKKAPHYRTQQHAYIYIYLSLSICLPLSLSLSLSLSRSIYISLSLSPSPSRPPLLPPSLSIRSSFVRRCSASDSNIQQSSSGAARCSVQVLQSVVLTSVTCSRQEGNGKGDTVRSLMVTYR